MDLRLFGGEEPSTSLQAPQQLNGAMVIPPGSIPAQIRICGDYKTATIFYTPTTRVANFWPQLQPPANNSSHCQKTALQRLREIRDNKLNEVLARKLTPSSMTQQSFTEEGDKDGKEKPGRPSSCARLIPISEWKNKKAKGEKFGEEQAHPVNKKKKRMLFDEIRVLPLDTDGVSLEEKPKDTSATKMLPAKKTKLQSDLKKRKRRKFGERTAEEEASILREYEKVSSQSQVSHSDYAQF